MARKKAHAGGHANSERWLLTYADLITLLLIYFIVLFAMSQVDVNKFHKLADAMSNAFNVIPSQGGAADSVLPPGSNEVMPPVAPMYEEKETFERIAEEVEKIAKQLGAQKSFEVRQTSRGLVISISDRALFGPGSADLNPGIKKALDKVGHLLADLHNSVRIEGHTDDRPIHSARFPSNWELSTARATSVVRYLIESKHLPPSRLSAAGYGEYFPRVPNTSEENRAKNRRIDIVLLRDAKMAQEPIKPQFTSPADVSRSQSTIPGKANFLPAGPVDLAEPKPAAPEGAGQANPAGRMELGQPKADLPGR